MSLRTNEFYYKSGKSDETQVLNRAVPEQVYSLRASLEVFLAKLMFPGDDDGLSRVMWSPRDYGPYRRLEQLGYTGTSDIVDDFQIPFATYHRSDAWVVDDRPAGQQLSSVMSKIRWGRDNTGFEAQALYSQREFDVALFLGSERDATHAMSLIFWWNNRPHWTSYKLQAGGTEIEIPATLELVGGPVLQPEANMTAWQKERKIMTVDFKFRVRT
ncbi:MAG: hypothetical protein LC687_04805, partial [Actinobacteria bacterium]|nr:hypothetical protein [Actinomycetota bacterium]MCA1807153.1 hypothetical protein [Actinomycetota bacterium]